MAQSFSPNNGTPTELGKVGRLVGVAAEADRQDWTQGYEQAQQLQSALGVTGDGVDQSKFVVALNGLQGEVTIVAGAGATIAVSGSTITIAAPTAGKTYIFPFSSSATWTINHNLNRYPSVTIVDGSGAVISPSSVTSITYDSANQITVVFGSAQAGTAYLN